MTTYMISECTESLNALRKDAARLQKRGLPFMMASVLLWTGIMFSTVCIENINERNFFIFCSSALLMPLASAFGLVDYCRIGCDVGLSWNDNMLMQLTHRERVSTKNSMQNTIFRRQLDKRAFLNDPDVFLLRDDNISLSGIQKQALAIVNDLFGSVYFTSDDMLAYNDKQKKVLDFAASLRGCKYEDVDIKNGYIYFTYTRNGKKTRAELAPGGSIHVVPERRGHK